MDGLSLLGLVCESKLQERHQKTELMEDVIEHIPVKVENLKYDDIAEDMDSEEDLGLVKKESQELDDDVVLIQSNELKSESFEKSSQAVATHLNIKDFGNFRYKIHENQLCKFSKYTGWHLQRSSGMMKIKLEFEKLKFSQDSLIVRALLVRKDETYRHYGVDRICENHRNEIGVENKEHVLHPVAGLDGMWYFDNHGQRNSLCFKLNKPNMSGHLEATIGLKIMCNDSCSTCDDPTFKPTESSRDLLLLLTLETLEFGLVLSRRSITIWPKAVVRPKDLNKPERRKPKGGAAKLNKKKEMIEKLKESKPQPSPPNQLIVKNSNCEQKKVNLIVPIETTNSSVTKLDIVNSSLDFTVRNARALGISKSVLLQMVEESYDKLMQYKS